jgi:hypothetical protein
MRKTTFEQRMKTYMVMVILIGAFLTLSTGYMWLTTHTTTVDMIDLPTIEKVNSTPLLNVVELDTVAQLSTINPDSYDGKIVIATADEVITMQTIDGVKYFTNYLIG